MYQGKSSLKTIGAAVFLHKFAASKTSSMVLSMTGFGRSEQTVAERRVRVEIRSLNSKNLDLFLKTSCLSGEHEMDVRRRVGERLVRGKIDVAISLDDAAVGGGAYINRAAVAGYREQIAAISRELGIAEPQDWWTVLRSMAGVTAGSLTSEEMEALWPTISRLLDEAVGRVVEFREQEGKAVAEKFSDALSNIARFLEEIEPYEQQRIVKIREQMEAQLQAIPLAQYDKGRLEQEMIYYIEKLDISEEKQRLTNHLSYFRETMQAAGAQGKKLGFIAQEMGREINTLGSKSNQAEMQRLVVRMKDELEQIKEQVLNVL